MNHENSTTGKLKKIEYKQTHTTYFLKMFAVKIKSSLICCIFYFG